MQQFSINKKKIYIPNHKYLPSRRSCMLLTLECYFIFEEEL